MLTILIGGIIGVIISLVIIFRSQNSTDTFMERLSLLVFLAIVGALIGLIVAISLPMKTYDKYAGSANIENLQDNESINGNFFLGCGQINGTMKYVFYYQDGDDASYRMGQIDCNLAQIQYTDSIPRVILNIKTAKETELINKFALDIDIGNASYIILVPKGTIRNNYELNSK